MHKSLLYHTSLKALFVLKILNSLQLQFGQVEKMAWLEKLISKFLASQLGYKAIGLGMIPNMSLSRDNQTTKFGNLTEYNKRSIFFKNYIEHEAEKIVPELFQFFNKLNMR